uniref:Uncharacterized protein n=1 Tax=Heterosigma akashiwo TaxID=2829 RepID=A0A7S3UTB5_HETAK
MRNKEYAEVRRKIFQGKDRRREISAPEERPENDEPVAILSLDEVPYDRDLKWCNQASNARPRRTVGKGHRMFQQVADITEGAVQEYGQLDSHYRALDQRKVLYDAEVGRNVAAAGGHHPGSQRRGGRGGRGRRGGGRGDSGSGKAVGQHEGKQHGGGRNAPPRRGGAGDRRNTQNGYRPRPQQLAGFPPGHPVPAQAHPAQAALRQSPAHTPPSLPSSPALPAAPPPALGAPPPTQFPLGVSAALVVPGLQGLQLGGDPVWGAPAPAPAPAPATPGAFTPAASPEFAAQVAAAREMIEITDDMSAALADDNLSR